MHLSSVAVFCGSSNGTDPTHRATAEALGRSLAARGIKVVYGGGTIGLMGAVADATLAAGGQVVGVMPQALADREVEHEHLTESHIVPDMHARKAMMADLSDGFIALPGGLGTLEEIAEQWTWSQLGIHDKPLAFLDVEGYWQPLRTMVRTMVDQGFLRPEIADRARFADSIEDCLAFLAR